MLSSAHRSTLALALALVLLGCPGDDGVVTPGAGTGTGDSTTGTSHADDGGSTLGVTSTGSSSSTGSGTSGSSSSGGSSSGGGSSSDDGSGSTGPAPECHDEDLPGVVPQTVMGTVTGAGDEQAPTCAEPQGAEDWVYRFTAPQDGVYRFETLDGELDTTVEVLGDCTGTSLACNDDPDGSLSRVDVMLSAGQTVQVVVDAVAGETGDFSLSISRLDFGGPHLCTPAGEAFAACNEPGPVMEPAIGTLACDISGLVVFDVYEIPVMAGDCLFARADNIDSRGPSLMIAGDLLIVIRDELGRAVTFDDEVPCSDPVFGGFACPQGGAVAAMDGSLFVAVGQYGGLGCPNNSPYRLEVTVGGVDVATGGTQVQEDLAVSCG